MAGQDLNILQSLDDNQRRAVLHDKGPCLCLAGAGSGKTRVLTYRIAQLIANGVDSDRILAVTFTNKAAKEMRDRVEDLVSHEKSAGLIIGTFHSVFWRHVLQPVWREEGDRRAEAAVAEGWEQKKWIKEILKDLNWNLEVSLAQRFISRQKRAGRSPDDDLLLPDGAEERESFYRSLYEEYEARKLAENRLDFDDMIFLTWRLFKSRSDIAARFQGRWDYVLLDEFQDTNPIQYETVRLLAARHRNFFAVGDDAQSIYGFQGASVQHILRFVQDWPGAVVIPLETNYRSVPPIVEAAGRLLDHAREKFPKSVMPKRGGGTPPTVVSLEDEDAEAAFISREIQALHKSGVPWREIAVLYRTNAQSRAVEDALVRENIPYVIAGSFGFYGRSEIRDVLAYLRLAVDPTDDDAFRRVLNVPSRYLGKVFMDSLTAWAHARKLGLFAALSSLPDMKPYQRRSVESFLFLVNRLRRLESSGASPSFMIQVVRKDGGYDAWLRGEEGDDVDNDRMENLDELQYAAGRFSSAKRFLEFADQVARATARDERADAVQCLTIHKAKGLEWSCVFLAGCVNGLLPHFRAVEKDDQGNVIPESIEEERRLMYVAMTRAKDRLWCCVPQVLRDRDMEPSPFLDEAGLERRDMDATEGETTDFPAPATQEAVL